MGWDGMGATEGELDERAIERAGERWRGRGSSAEAKTDKKRTRVGRWCSVLTAQLQDAAVGVHLKKWTVGCRLWTARWRKDPASRAQQHLSTPKLHLENWSRH